jgi:hypothetical protein
MTLYAKLDAQTQVKARQFALEFLDDMMQLRLAYLHDLTFMMYAQGLKEEPSRLVRQIIFNDDGSINERINAFYFPLRSIPKH